MGGRWAGALLALSMFGGSANAQEEMPEFYVVHRYAWIRPVPTFDKAERAVFAGAVTDYCVAVIRAMPTNTPAEDAWVHNEGNTTNLDKVRHLTATAEYARFSLAKTYNECVHFGKKLLAAQSADNRMEEADLFAALAATFNYDGDMRIYARQATMNENWFGIASISSLRDSLLRAAMRAIESLSQ
jgi:hypothetical protein